MWWLVVIYQVVVSAILFEDGFWKYKWIKAL